MTSDQRTAIAEAQSKLRDVSELLTRLAIRPRRAGLNTLLALATNDMAARELAALRDREGDDELTEQLARTSSLVRALSGDDWEQLITSEDTSASCVESGDSRGELLHWCAQDDDEERTFPCLACPLTTTRLRNFEPIQYPRTERTDQDGGADDEADPDDRAQPAAAIGMIEEAALLLQDMKTDRRLDRAIIAMGNTAHYLEKTTRPERADGPSDVRATEAASDRLHGILMRLLGDDDGRAVRIRQDDDNFCIRTRDAEDGMVTHFCRPPSGEPPPEIAREGGATAEPCAECPYGRNEPRATVADLLSARWASP